MQQSIDRLVDVLNRQSAQLALLADAADEEQDMLRRLSAARLGALNAQRERLIGILRELEQERTDIVNELASMWGLPVHAITVSLVAERVGAAESATLRRQHQRLSELIGRVRRAMGINRHVVDGFLEFIRKALGAWQQPSSAQGLYSLAGRQERPHTGGGIVAYKG